MSPRPPALCRLCNEIKPLVEAHIIPKSIIKQIKSSTQSQLVEVMGVDPSRTKRLPIGHYDTNILCQSCDGRLGKYDDYGKTFIFNIANTAQPVTDKGRLVALKVAEYDYAKLKLFFLSILWRASISQLHFFKHIQLGPYESTFHDMIDTEDPGTPDAFPVMLDQFTGIEREFTFMNPACARSEGVRHWQLYLIACNAMIKVDKRRGSDSFHIFALSPTPPLYILLTEFARHRMSDRLDRIMRELKGARR